MQTRTPTASKFLPNHTRSFNFYGSPTPACLDQFATCEKENLSHQSSVQKQRRSRQERSKNSNSQKETITLAETQSVFEDATNLLNSQRPYVDEINTDDEFSAGNMKPFCDDSSDDQPLFKQNSDLVPLSSKAKPVCPPLIFKPGSRLKSMRTPSEGRPRPSTTKSRDCMIGYNPFKQLIQGKGSQSSYKVRDSSIKTRKPTNTIDFKTIESKIVSRRVNQPAILNEKKTEKSQLQSQITQIKQKINKTAKEIQQSQQQQTSIMEGLEHYIRQDQLRTTKQSKNALKNSVLQLVKDIKELDNQKLGLRSEFDFNSGVCDQLRSAIQQLKRSLVAQQREKERQAAETAQSHKVMVNLDTVRQTAQEDNCKIFYEFKRAVKRQTI